MIGGCCDAQQSWGTEIDNRGELGWTYPGTAGQFGDAIVHKWPQRDAALPFGSGCSVFPEEVGHFQSAS